ncbi:MAG: tRNA pseudouridine(13) synthase TruD [Nitrososphaerales archaeon]
MVLMKTDSGIRSIDAQIGIYEYATDFEGIGGRIRSRYEDFRVEEILDPQTSAGISDRPTSTNRYPVYRLVKEGVDTLHAVQQIRRRLGWGTHYLGLKDSRAQTMQYISPKRLKEDAPKDIQVSPQISLELYGYHNSLLTRRSLAGNRFTIRITDTESGGESLKTAASELKRAVKGMGIPNFYGYQRFGAKRPINHLVGRDIVRGRFEEAVTTLLTYSSEQEDEETRVSREEVKDPANYPSLLKRLKWNQDIERRVVKSLIDHPRNWVKALRAVPISVRRLFINSYQSYIFNRVMSKAVEEDLDLVEVDADDIYGAVDAEDGSVTEIRRSRSRLETGGSKKNILPLVQLVGYAYRAGRGRFDQMTQGLLEEEAVSPRQFYIKQMPELSMEGGFRISPLLADDLDIWTESTDRSSCLLQFTLLKGSYATMILRELMKPSDPVAAGF